MYSRATGDYRVVSEGVLVGAALFSSWRLCIILLNVDVDLGGKLTCSCWFFKYAQTRLFWTLKGSFTV